jgi:hypothetical protein
MKIAKPVVGGKRSYLRAKLSVLPEICPHDEGRPCTCPLHAVRKTNVTKRMEWFDKLSDESVLNIYTFCRLCFETSGQEAKTAKKPRARAKS